MISETETSRDHLEAMVRQEEKHYKCVDYLEVDEPEPTCSPLNVVAECALLVTDVYVRPASPAEKESSCVLGSPSRANKLKSPKTSCADLYYLSEPPPQPIRSSSPRPAVELSFLNSWRHQMLDWAYTVTEIFNIDREVVAVAFSILDRYLAIELEADDDCPISREDFQLYSMVSMYVTIKILIPFRKLAVETLIDMSSGFYTAEDITAKEHEILTALNWHVNPPTVIDFCRMYMRLFPLELSHEVEETCQYIAELALDDVYFISKSSSSVSLATILLAAQQCGISANETHGFLENIQGLVNIQSNEFDSILRRLECLC